MVQNDMVAISRGQNLQKVFFFFSDRCKEKMVQQLEMLLIPNALC